MIIFIIDDDVIELLEKEEAQVIKSICSRYSENSKVELWMDGKLEERGILSDYFNVIQHTGELN